MNEKKSIGNIFTLLIIGIGGLVLGYYSLQGHLLNQVLSIFPLGTALACFIAIFLPNKKKNNKKTISKTNTTSKNNIVSKKNLLHDPRIYYIIALILILIYPPMNYHENLKFIYFDGWHPITELGGSFDYGDQYSLNLTYLSIEFIFVSIVFLLFYKKRK